MKERSLRQSSLTACWQGLGSTIKPLTTARSRGRGTEAPRPLKSATNWVCKICRPILIVTERPVCQPSSNHQPKDLIS
jgi:hypothetical protein